MINFVIIMSFAGIGAISVSKFVVTQGIRLRGIWKEVKAESAMEQLAKNLLSGIDRDEDM